MAPLEGAFSRENPQSAEDKSTNIDFAELLKLCTHYFGQPRNSGSSHFVFAMPWAGDPRVNIQNDHGKAKAYQVRQVLSAIAKLEGEEQ